MQYGSKEWQPWILEDEEEAMKHIKAAYDLGIQTFDTSNIYSNGLGEVLLGKAIKQLGLPREEIVVMTKFGHFVPKDGPGSWMELTSKAPEEHGLVNQGGVSRKHIFDAVKASLERLQLDYIDVLQCHRIHPDTPMPELMNALHDVVKAGYVRYIGIGSSCYAWQFQYMQNYALNNKLTPFISLQNHYHLLDREDEPEVFPTLRLLGAGSLPFSPLARGLLARPLGTSTQRSQTDRVVQNRPLGIGPRDHKTASRLGSSNLFFLLMQAHSVEKIANDKSVSMAQVAIAWLLHKKGVTAPIIGPTSIEQLEDSVAALKLSLNEDDMTYLEAPYQPRPNVRQYLIPYHNQWANWR
ncbi:hypothetical protein ONZ45_g12999 [Pleurotus djamor]|nr:hypothetical protein ONZ45_g12999 [Pleurotus djamor]